ncbi:putative membrane protein [Halobiforma haloterrestris]|uniref:Putative membrane protein n=1 Tax=Natronobacterium haloterrestre TaxID=148448 RepID=A0A1I1K0Z1_NATHA|nr:SHOCT domain-containing protein [Halobiforma haloterrestris]SFC52428.1 putative membrane protein [Halobiforma haloterrestris]
MSSSTQLDTTTLILLLLGAIIVLPMLTMGFGFGGMMGRNGTSGGWWPFTGILVPIVFLLALLGGGYLVVRSTTENRPSQPSEMEELRRSYARGELTDEEFETRRKRLERSE